MATQFPEPIQVPIVDPLEQEINQSIDRMIFLLNQRRIHLLTTLRNKREETRANQVACQQMKQQLEETRALVEGKMTHNQLHSISDRLVAEMQTKLAELHLNTPPPHVLRFLCDTQDLERSINRLGEISQQEIHPIPHIPVIPKYAEFQQPIVTVGITGSAPGEFKGPSGVAIEPESGHIYVADMLNNRIQIFSQSGDYLNQFGNQHLKKPWGILIHEDNIYVTDIVHYAIFLFKLPDLTMIKRVGKEGSGSEEFNNPRQPAISPNTHLYVPDYNNNRLQILTTNLVFTDTLEHKTMTGPIDVKFTNNEMFVLSLKDNPCIHVFTLSGEKSYSLITGELGMQVGRAYFFCLDGHNNIIISDCLTNNIKVFSPEGDLLHKIGQRGHKAGMFVTTNQNTSIEQLSAHLQTTNQNTVYTSQLIKLVEANLLARIELIEKSSQEGVNRLNQLFDHVTQKQSDIVLKLEPLLENINNNISTTSQEVLCVTTALTEIKEELRQIRNKQDSILLLPNQSDARVTRDPLDFQDRPKEGESQVGQLWDLLEKKPEIVSHKPDTILPSEPTAFTPVKLRPSSAFQLSVTQAESCLGSKLTNQMSIDSQSITSLDPLSSLPTSHSSMVQSLYPQQSMPPSITPVPVSQLLQPSLMHIQSLQSIPAVSHYPPHSYSNIMSNQSNVQYPPQSMVQSNPQLPLQSAVPSNPQLPLQPAVQSNPQLPLQPAVQSNPQLPLQSAVQSNPQLPLQSAVQSNPQLPLQSAVQSNPQLPLQSAVQPNSPLNPQQHAYLQMLQKQLGSNPQSLTPDQLMIIQKQLLLLSQTHQ
ncbi:hypothetical protein LOD99_15806 [Oopsacas minuta]|uniref:Uncharacterized protein n=1 Tax=Oopsacas minuta TaxID=111878 RepID=A0AAV7KAC6_9METZ|nr:hypothetical protein LOD99_15806 [Oopsacas minuta]